MFCWVLSSSEMLISVRVFALTYCQWNRESKSGAVSSPAFLISTLILHWVIDEKIMTYPNPNISFLNRNVYVLNHPHHAWWRLAEQGGWKSEWKSVIQTNLVRPKWCCAEPLGSWLARWACKWLSSPSKGETDFVFPASDACASAPELLQEVVTFGFLFVSYTSQTPGTDTFVHVRAEDSCHVPVIHRLMSRDICLDILLWVCESWLTVGVRINRDEDGSTRLTFPSNTPRQMSVILGNLYLKVIGHVKV